MSDAPRTVDQIDWSQYDFVDMGCSDGGSLRHCAQRFGKPRGIGADIAPGKVKKALARGIDAVVADATKIDLKKQVSFVSMMNFLEHLPNLEVVEAVIGAAARSARDFLFIRHPSFEGEELGEAIGYRQFWWTWDHHPTHIRIVDYCNMFDRLGLADYRIRYVDRASTTAHPSVVPASMGPNISKVAARGAPKTHQPLPMSWWRRQDIFIALRPYEPAEWLELTKPHQRDLDYNNVDD